MIEKGPMVPVPARDHLTDIEHIVLCLQEEAGVVRSLFRHAFCRRQVRHSDAAEQQKGWNGDAGAGLTGITLPYRINTTGVPTGLAVRQRPRPPVDCRAVMAAPADGWLPAQALDRSMANTPRGDGLLRADIPIHYLLADTFDLRPVLLVASWRDDA